ncbi:hypothetical protein P692DRAFT_201868732 [Suillus brevipes Sb2]|nr:hypothetical protein P692DRAFT_201868732 [Suillus brevipes Sb2]
MPQQRVTTRRAACKERESYKKQRRQAAWKRRENEGNKRATANTDKQPSKLGTRKVALSASSEQRLNAPQGATTGRAAWKCRENDKQPSKLGTRKVALTVSSEQQPNAPTTGYDKTSSL